jgi:hypothetical protein
MMVGASIWKRIGAYRVWWGNLKKIVYLEDAGIDERIILNRIFKKWDGNMDWFDLTQDRDGWWAFESVAM